MPGVSCEQGTLEVGGVGPQDTEVVMAMSECPDGDSGVGAATTSTAGTPAPSSNTTHESTTRDDAPLLLLYARKASCLIITKHPRVMSTVSTVLVTVGGFVLLPGVSACIGHVIFTPQAVQAIGAISVAVGKWLKTALDSTTKTAIRSSGKGGVENVDDGKCCCTQVCKRLPLRGPPGTLQ